MPYLTQNDREGLKPLADAAGLVIRDKPMGQQAGAVNYMVFRMLTKVLGIEKGDLYGAVPRAREFNYARLNEMVGALECCKLELYRRLVGPYEGEAKKRNGDVI